MAAAARHRTRRIHTLIFSVWGEERSLALLKVHHRPDVPHPAHRPPRLGPTGPVRVLEDANGPLVER